MQTNSTNGVAADILSRDPEFKLHLQALGLNAAEDYADWCARHGFSMRLDKHWRERCKERYVAAQDTIKRRLARQKHEKRHPQRCIENIFAGQADPTSFVKPHLRIIHQIATNVVDPDTRDALRTLLLHVDRRADLLTTRPATTQFATQIENTFIGGMFGLARHCSDWLRPVHRWRPCSKNPGRQFSSLARHLLAKYPVPRFMDSVWFLRCTDQADEQQSWFKRLARGQNPRKLNLPLRLTKRMAHFFLQAPQECSVAAALRWGQVLGMGGNAQLVSAILGSRIATDFENNDFWETVIRWLIDNATFNSTQIGPLIDYIHHRKYQSANSDLDPSAHPYNPEFSMKGRSAHCLIRQMRDWHARLHVQPERPQLHWHPCGIGSFDMTEGDLAAGNLRRWTIVEILSRRDLYHEGQVMRHCVASYEPSCLMGGTSIWSLCLERNLGRRKRMLTIELASGSNICQIRGKANRLPQAKEMSIVHRWAAQEGLNMNAYV